MNHPCWEGRAQLLAGSFVGKCQSVSQLPPPPVPAESQQSSFGVLVAEGCG